MRPQESTVVNASGLDDKASSIVNTLERRASVFLRRENIGEFDG